MNLLVFKLIVTPLLLLIATMAVRRWGEAIGGFFISLPLTSGPILVFLALERGPEFAAQATAGSLVAMAAQAGFGLAFYRLAASGWPVALTIASAAFCVVAGVLQWGAPSQTGLLLIVLAVIAFALRFMPEVRATGERSDPPWWDLPARMVFVAGLVVGVTLIAPHVGPAASGVLASFPFMAAILTVFAHRMSGHCSAQQVVRGLVMGLPGITVFFYVLGLTLAQWHLLAAFGVAMACTLLIHAISLSRMRFPVADSLE